MRHAYEACLRGQCFWEAEFAEPLYASYTQHVENIGYRSSNLSYLPLPRYLPLPVGTYRYLICCFTL